jgi:hypothetical protein
MPSPPQGLVPAASAGLAYHYHEASLVRNKPAGSLEKITHKKENKIY